MLFVSETIFSLISVNLFLQELHSARGIIICKIAKTVYRKYTITEVI